jgi:hypothetical protein
LSRAACLSLPTWFHSPCLFHVIHSVPKSLGCPVMPKQVCFCFLSYLTFPHPHHLFCSSCKSLLAIRAMSQPPSTGLAMLPIQSTCTSPAHRLLQTMAMQLCGHSEADPGLVCGNSQFSNDAGER